MKTILFFITLLCQQGQCLLVVVFTYNFAAARVEILLSLRFFFFFLFRSFYPPLVWFRGSEAGGGSSCFLAKLLSLCLCQTRIFLIWNAIQKSRISCLLLQKVVQNVILLLPTQSPVLGWLLWFLSFAGRFISSGMALCPLSVLLLLLLTHDFFSL